MKTCSDGRTESGLLGRTGPGRSASPYDQVAAAAGPATARNDTRNEATESLPGEFVRPPRPLLRATMMAVASGFGIFDSVGDRSRIVEGKQ